MKSFPLNKKFYAIFWMAILFAFGLMGCNSAALFLPSPIPTTEAALLVTILPTETPSPSATPSPTPSQSATQTSTPTKTATTTLTPTPTPVLVTPEKGQVQVPILLYHHIKDFQGRGQQYYVSVADFKEQMRALHEWGYQTLTVTQLVDIILKKEVYPQRSVVITFDDGNLDVYQNAFPVMQSLGLKGTVYVVATELTANLNLSVDVLKEMAKIGWEIGSHSMTHPDLTKSDRLGYEICESRTLLAKEVGVKVMSFAYPYGAYNDHVFQITRDCGYSSGAGLGLFNQHSLYSLFYLSRREVKGGMTLADFANLLPWNAKP